MILGQDPYYKRGQATGHAFAVPEEVSLPPSLRIIRDEVGKCYPDTKESLSAPAWRTLQHWQNQGVFLLNTALTVEEGNPCGHMNHWAPFVNEVIGIISEVTHPIWVLWGRHAQRKAKHIRGYDNVILTAPHPASGLYTDGNSGFNGCNHFTLVNQILRGRGQSEIHW